MKIIIIISIGIVALSILDLIFTVIKYIDARKKTEYSNNELISLQIESFKHPEPDYSIRIKYNEDLLDLINKLVDIEVGSKLKTLLLLNTDYKVTDIDSDVEEISNTVFNALKYNIIDDKFNMLSSDYIMSYIAKTTSMNILYHYREIHENFKPNN
jgi:hypothetical protein